MATGGRKGGGDFLLESRHLVGLFLLLVVIFGMVFTLGYMLGRSQYDSGLRAATTSGADAELPPARKLTAKQEAPKPVIPEAEPPAEAPAPPPAPNWDFYHSADSGAPDDHHVSETPKPNTEAPLSAAASKPSSPVTHPSSKSAAPLNAALIPKGAIMLQVAALKSQTDALALAQALQQKKFPAFVIPPGADQYYRVQVGPYKTVQAAAAGRDGLEAQGFKSITKR